MLIEAVLVKAVQDQQTEQMVVLFLHLLVRHDN
jgi:hypothetical protein